MERSAVAASIVEPEPVSRSFEELFDEEHQRLYGRSGS